MPAACSDSDYIGKARRDDRLAVIWVGADVLDVSAGAPGDNGAIGAKRNAVIESGRDGDDIGKIVGNFNLAEGIVACRNHESILLKSQAVQSAARDGDAISRFVPEIGLANRIVAPGLESAVSFYPEAVPPATGDVRGVGEGI